MKQRNNRGRVQNRDEVVGFPLNLGGEVMEEKIRRRAYELYEQRGREEGHAMDDWLRAEAEILKRRTTAA